VSPEESQPGWKSYRDSVVATRKNIRDSINTMEKALHDLQAKPDKADSAEVKELVRQLDWTYRETAYIAPNRSVTVNPRLPEGVSPLGVASAKRALGVLGEGDSETRTAILEFQRGRNKRNPSQWPEADINGELSGRTSELLPFLSPMPPTFRTPFERAFHGNNEGPLVQRLTQVSPEQLSALLAVVMVTDSQVPANSPPDVIGVKMNVLRDKLAELRKARRVDPDQGGVLDARLYNSLMSQ
jgi:hypothetical protein